MEGFDGEILVLVLVGCVYFLCVMEKGEVWVWGCGKSGRFGLGSLCDEFELMLLEDVEGCVF